MSKISGEENFERVYLGKWVDNRKYTCPNCGAPIKGEECSFCGTRFIDFACIDTDKPFLLKIKQGEKIFVAVAQLSSVEMKTDMNILYADNAPFMSVPNTNLEMNFALLECKPER